MAQDPNFAGQPPDLMLVGEEVTSGVLQPEVGAVLEDILGLNLHHSLAPSMSMGMMGGPECKLSIWNPFATLILTPSSLTGLLQDKEHVTESLSSLLPAAVAAAPQPPPDPHPTPKNWYISLEKQPGLAEVPSHRNCRVGMFMKEVGWAGFPGGPVVRTSCFHCPGLRVQSLVRDIISCLSWGMDKKKWG